MTTKDKTGDQLMASIRKTKGEDASPDKASDDASKAMQAPQKTATVKSKPAAPAGTVAKRPRTTKKKVAARSRPKAKAPQAASAEKASAYQSVRRVWPD